MSTLGVFCQTASITEDGFKSDEVTVPALQENTNGLKLELKAYFAANAYTIHISSIWCHC
jgi:hypothetical protein